MSAVVPVRDGSSVIGMFNHAGRFYAISIPHETLGRAVEFFLAHGRNGPFSIVSGIDFEEVQPIDLPAERHLRVVREPEGA